MRILFVTYCRAMLGANLCMMSLIKDLRDRYDVESFVVVPEVNDGDLAEVLDTEKIPYVISPMKPWVVSSDAKLKLLRGYRSYSLNKRYVSELADKLKDEKFDLVYSNNSTIQMGFDLAKRLGVPHVWHVREFGLKDYNIVFSYPSFMVRRKFLQSDAVVTISKAIDEHVRNTISGRLSTSLVYDGVEMDLPSKGSFERNDGVCNFACVGVLQEGKNQLELLKASALLLADGISDFKIHLIGDGGEYRKMLEQFVKDNKLDNNVIFYGSRDDVADLLSKMDCGVICSKSEAFGRVTVEYMLASLPVIGAAGAGTSEIIDNGKTGLLYESGNIEQLKEAMKKMISDENFQASLGQEGYRRAKEKFSVKANTDGIFELLNSI